MRSAPDWGGGNPPFPRLRTASWIGHGGEPPAYPPKMDWSKNQCARDKHTTKQILMMLAWANHENPAYAWGKHGSQCTYTVQVSFEWSPLG